MPYNTLSSSTFLQDKVILVTGAATGIGRVIAKAYAENGATVILLSRSVPLLEGLYDEIIQAGLPKPAIYPLNLLTATPPNYEELQENIEKYFGRLDGILYNAAHLGSLTPIEHHTVEQWYEVMQVNLHSPFLLTQAVLPLLKRAPEASIIFTTCEVGLKAKAYWGAYAVSKFGCQGLMQILADELETNTAIRVNSINPGNIKTQLRTNAYPAENPEYLREPQDLIPIYLYLMGPKSRGITGRCFDGLHFIVN
jgi:NAD(P)-dependent dehydrogenase (short-subunit alcohol dehydrogenase family)